MSDFKNLFKITVKRYGIWILLISLMIAMTYGLQSRARLKNEAENLRGSVNVMAEDLDTSIDNEGKITKEYLDEASTIADKYAEKYGILTDDQMKNLADEDWNDYSDKAINKYGSKFWEYESNYRTFQNIKESNLEVSNIFTYYIEDTAFGIVVLVAILAMLITSLEQSLSFYDFTLMFPWKKRDEVWMKALVVFIIGLAMFLINLLLNIAMISSSDFAPLMDFSKLGDPILQSILLIFATSFITVSTGMIAGNFLGHAGLGIIAIGSIELLRYIVNVFLTIFAPNFASSMYSSFSKFVENLPGVLKPFFSLINVKMDYPTIIGYIIVAGLWTLLAYLINSKSSSEKSGYLIISKPVEYVAKIWGILSFTTVLYLIGSAPISGMGSMILELIIYVVALLISIKLFDILFKVRLKF
ncbi:ABC transporter permease [Anaerococcus provencensis]|uniref:ABC transporter permease n=1 Tax=Anaerococcus provencensis TaxID=938293 RepID=UPI0003038EC3|nr:ABC transporter permease [Anaerococcus provencensis]